MKLNTSRVHRRLDAILQIVGLEAHDLLLCASFCLYYESDFWLNLLGSLSCFHFTFNHGRHFVFGEEKQTTSFSHTLFQVQANAWALQLRQ